MRFDDWDEASDLLGDCVSNANRPAIYGEGSEKARMKGILRIAPTEISSRRDTPRIVGSIRAERARGILRRRSATWNETRQRRDAEDDRESATERYRVPRFHLE
jgi:hypothetical protein